MLKEFLYSLTDANGLYYRYLNKVVEATSQYSSLKNTPDGWQEKSLQWERDVNLHGVFRSFTTQLKFVTEGARIIRERLYKQGTEDVMRLLIHKLDTRYFEGWEHKQFYVGELDLTTADDNDDFVAVSLAEDDISKAYQANKDTDIEIPVDIPGSESVLMDGITLSQQASFIVTNGSLPNDLGGATVDMQLINTESIQGIGATTQPRIRTGNSASALWNLGSTLLVTGDQPTEVTVDWDFWMTSQLAGGVGPVNPVNIIFQFLLVSAPNTINTVILQNFVGDPLFVYGRKHFQGTKTFTIPPNVKCFTYMSASTNRDFTFWTYDNGGSFNIKYSYKHRSTFCKVLPPNVAGQYIVDKVFGPGYTFRSDYLSGVWAGLRITSGDAIRGLANAVVKTTFSKFFNSYNVPCSLSLNMSGSEIRIEPKGFAYQQQTVYDFGEVSDMRIKPDKSFKYNVLEIGYPNTDTEDVNGRYDFNVTASWNTTIKKSPKKLQIVSDYSAGCFEIELTRINLSGKNTTDATTDNKTFFIHTETIRRTDPVGGLTLPDNGYFRLYRKAYTSVAGVPFPAGLYNVELSPARCIGYQGAFLRSVFYQQEGGYLTFGTSQKNRELTTNDGGVIISEKGNVLIGSLAAPLFYPYTVEFNSPIVDEIVQIMKESGNKQFAAQYDGYTVYGFARKISLQPAENAPQLTTLMLSPQSNILNFIADGR